ncbi:hypothetical protein N864_23625 [Intrasporangium chromatireducens Q5-1]|uniref:Uncharacterized protein n=1 Tax=Intrasporangium chromatireducens Q5-1 TaxID=584657 RepID=W9GRT4_9MICO|nr:hypothetical protein [Intrasporangium chromatireducens]EWT07772.1 hypothetical protein N864_23625 [Intrasporangium chromatireducens Q5-1]
MTTAGIPAHALLPLALLFTAAAALTASLAFRLARASQRRAGWLAIGAPLIPAVRPHLARDGADLAAIVLASVVLFVAVMYAQRTRVAQLPLLWGSWVDRYADRLAGEQLMDPIRAKTGRRARRRYDLRRWRGVND